jgi:nucleotide-binding universal stress UspA family protein
MKFNRILIGIDLSPDSESRARWVATMFAPKAEVTLVHAVQIPEPPHPLRGRFASLAAIRLNAVQGATVRLQKMAQSLSRDRTGPRVAIMVPVGEPASVLLEVSAEAVADLIVLGQHVPRGALWDWIGGTVERVMLDGTTCVLVVGDPPSSAPQHFVVGLDGGDVAPWVLRATAQLAERFGAVVHGVHVADLLPGGAIGPFGSASYVPDTLLIDRIVRLEGNAWRDQMARAGIDPVRTACDVTFGDPSERLLEASRHRGVDLIIVGNGRSSRRLGRLLGSTARRILRQAPCPVLVVAEPSDELVPAVFTGQAAQTLRESRPMIAPGTIF